MNVCAPEFWDFWQHLFSTVSFDVRDLAKMRGVSRAFKVIIDAHAEVDLSMKIKSHRDFYSHWRSLPMHKKESLFRIRKMYKVLRTPEAQDFPRSLVGLSFHRTYNTFFDSHVLPRSLVHLRFGSYFDRSVDTRGLPPSLASLSFGFFFNRPIDVAGLPRSLTHLEFEGFFNRPIEARDLPRSLTNLHFGAHFNQPLESRDLPRSLVSLKLFSGTDHPPDLDGLPDPVREYYWWDRKRDANKGRQF